jgi:hypothetical protein
MKIRIFCDMHDEEVDVQEYFGLSDEEWNELSEKERGDLVEGFVTLHAQMGYVELS